MTAEPAQQISHYRVVRKLGEGGMGEVWEAIDDRIQRRVAIKLLSAVATSTDRQARFVREARAAGALSHPGIITLYDVGLADDGRLFLVMELLEGRSLHEVARAGITPEKACLLVAEAADALAVAHAQGILHRDIKSDNLMLTKDGRVKVLDFGLAKLRSDAPLSTDDGGSLPPPPAAIDPGDLMASEANTVIASPKARPTTLEPERAAAGTPMPPPRPLTRAGSVMGTPGFMAPEQTLGEAVTTESEVFSLGIVLYELLARRRPFDRVTMAATMEATRSAPARPPSEHKPGITPAMDAVVARALEKEKARRYPDMTAFAAALREAAAEPRLAAARRRTRRLAAAIAGALIVLLGGGFTWWRLTRPAAIPQPAVTSSKRITFDSGCEEWPVFTPDGRTVIYDGLAEGDYEILSLELASGRRTRLTHSPHWDYSAAISADGRRIAYIHQGDEEEVRVLSIGGDEIGEPVVLGRSWSVPAWNDAGDVVSGTDRELVTWVGGRPDERKVLAKLPKGLLLNALAPLDHGELLLLLGTFAQDAPANVWRRTAEGQMTMLPVEAYQYGIVAAPSKGAFYHLRTSAAGGDELVRRRRDGSQPRVVEGGLAPPGGFAIAPDGKRMVYSSCKSKTTVGRLIPGDEDGRIELLTPDATWQDMNPTVLGQDRILVTSDRSGDYELWSLDRKSGFWTVIGPGYRPVPSPDGVWVSYSQEKPPGLYVRALSGGAEVRLTEETSDTMQQFVSDASQLVFVRTTADGDRLMAVPRAGGPARELQPDVDISVMAVSPTADMIAYVRQDSDAMRIMITNAAGAPARQLGAPLTKGYYSALRFSQDGTRLLLTQRETDLLELPLNGGPAKRLWRAKTEAIGNVELTREGELITSVVRWDGDLWLAEGNFP